MPAPGERSCPCGGWARIAGSSSTSRGGVARSPGASRAPAASYHVIVPSRGVDVVTGFLGEARPEVWGSDAFPTQFAAPAGLH